MFAMPGLDSLQLRLRAWQEQLAGVWPQLQSLLDTPGMLSITMQPAEFMSGSVSTRLSQCLHNLSLYRRGHCTGAALCPGSCSGELVWHTQGQHQV